MFNKECLFEFMLVLLYFRFFQFKFFKKNGIQPRAPTNTVIFGDPTLYRELGEVTLDTIGVRFLAWKWSFASAAVVFFPVILIEWNDKIASAVAFCGLGMLISPSTFKGSAEFELYDPPRESILEGIKRFIKRQIDFSLNRKLMTVFHTAIIWVLIYIFIWMFGIKLRINNLIPPALCLNTSNSSQNWMVTDSLIVLMSINMFLKTWASGAYTFESPLGFMLSFSFHVMSRTFVAIFMLSLIVSYSAIVSSQDFYHEMLLILALLVPPLRGY